MLRHPARRQDLLENEITTGDVSSIGMFCNDELNQGYCNFEMLFCLGDLRLGQNTGLGSRIFLQGPAGR